MQIKQQIKPPIYNKDRHNQDLWKFLQDELQTSVVTSWGSKYTCIRMFLQHLYKQKLVLGRDFWFNSCKCCIAHGMQMWHKAAPLVQISSKNFESVTALADLTILDPVYGQFPNSISKSRLVVVHSPATGLKLKWMCCVCFLILRNGKFLCLMQVIWQQSGDQVLMNLARHQKLVVQISKYIQYKQLSRSFEG